MKMYPKELFAAKHSELYQLVPCNDDGPLMLALLSSCLNNHIKSWLHILQRSKVTEYPAITVMAYDNNNKLKF